MLLRLTSIQGHQLERVPEGFYYILALLAGSNLTDVSVLKSFTKIE